MNQKYDEIEFKLKQINMGLDSLVRTMRELLVVVGDLTTETHDLKMTLTRDKDVLKFIQNNDYKGINYPKLVLLHDLKKIQGLEEIYIRLLKSGEIFEVAGYVYPLDTKNKVWVEDDV